MTSFERALAISIASLSLATIAWLLFFDGAGGGLMNDGDLFKVPRFNYGLLIATCGVAAAMALGIALRNQRFSPAYSLACGLAAWSSFVLGVVGPAFLPAAFCDAAAFLVLFLTPWSAARFALHFPAELRVAPESSRPLAIRLAHLRAFVDSPVYPSAMAILTLANAFDVLVPVVGASAADFILGWSYIILGAAMLGSAVLLLVAQRQQADAAGSRRLRWIWRGAWGAIALLIPALGFFPVLNEPGTMYIAFLLAGLGPAWLIGCVIAAVFFFDALAPRLGLGRPANA